ncbi:MAG: hypothetical protein J7494_10395 [Sphingobium sp.]|nr:hypothetical protein [Sphingobium sp.]
MYLPSTDADKYILLFSSDWFMPYWQVLGLQVREGHALRFQQTMRALATELMKDAKEYWHIAFGEDRVQSTREKWLGALTSHSAKTSRLVILDRWHFSSAERKELRTALAADFSETWAEINDASVDTTEWDRWLLSLTPDLPELLKDSAWAAIHG